VAPTLVTALKQAGYSCFLFSSGFISDSGLAPFYLSQKYDKVFDPTGLPDLKNDDFWSWGVKKHVMVDKIVAFMEKHKAQNDGPFFLYYRTAFPHAPFQPVAPGYNVFDTSDRMRGSYVGSFKNCLLYLDEQFARLVSEIERIGLRENTILAFIGDHGEMVGEEEYGRRVGHGTSLNPMLTNVPFIIVHPDEKSAGINHTPGSMPDIGATLLRLINCPPLPTVFSQGSDLRDPLRQPGPIYLSSLTQRAMIENGNYYQFPFPGTDDMRHFRIVASGGRAIFASQTESSADTLTTSYAKILKFMGLQSHLLTHIETYSKEFESRATASMSATLD
jgi:phosphoglycerol transferase MdoB-like AlkP superfamily enzyme